MAVMPTRSREKRARSHARARPATAKPAAAGAAPRTPNLPVPAGAASGPARAAPKPAHPNMVSADRDSLALTAYPSMIDRAVHASLARMTGGLSPMAMAETYTA